MVPGHSYHDMANPENRPIFETVGVAAQAESPEAILTGLSRRLAALSRRAGCVLAAS